MAALIGCAEGMADENVDDQSSLTSIPIEGGTGDENSVKLPPPTSNIDASDEDAGGDAGAPKTDGGGGTPDGGGPVVDYCKAPTVCSGATSMGGAVSGDEGSTPVTIQGTGSQWLKVIINETDSSTFANDEKAHIAFTPPPGETFDLIVYRAAGTTNLECTTSASTAPSTSAPQTVDLSWGESGLFSNGDDDSSLVTIEVRHVGTGACSPTAKWTVTVSGN